MPSSFAHSKRKSHVHAFAGRRQKQTRTGAGAAIAGYLAQKDTTSSETATKKTVTALTNAAGLLAMVPSIASVFSPECRLVLQVSCASQERDEISNNYAAVLSAAAALGDDFTIVLSAHQMEADRLATACYASEAKGNIVFVFDGAFAGRGRANAPICIDSFHTSMVGALNSVGYANFIYEGSSAPKALVIVPNGSHFTAARAVLTRANVGIISVQIVRPWSDADLLELIPSSVERIYVLDEVLVKGMNGVLYEDVQASIMSRFAGGSAPTVQPIALRAGESLSASQWLNVFSEEPIESPRPVISKRKIRSSLRAQRWRQANDIDEWMS